MKKLLIILSVLCVGCDDVKIPDGTAFITTKGFASSGSFTDSDCKCTFFYTCANGYKDSFIDSCYKYNVGDTINFNH